MTINERISDLVNPTQAIFYGCLALIGETIQRGGGNSLLENSLSDFAIPAEYVAVSEILLKNRSPILKNIVSVIIPTLCTLHELCVINLDPSSQTYDSKDIAAYWMGASLAYGISRLSEKFQKRATT